MEATTKDLRLHTRELIAATDRGERVTITFRGKPRAMLTPIEQPEPASRAERNPAFGLWADVDSLHDVDQLVRTMRKPRSFE